MRILAVLPAAIFILSRPAIAAEPSTILVEVRVGAGQVEQQHVVEGFLDGWRTTIVHGAPLARLIERQLSRSAGPSGGLLPRINAALDEIQQKKHAVHGNWKAIIALLKPIRDDLANHVRLVSTDNDTREAAFQSLILLARAYQGANSSETMEILTDIIRSFRDKQVTVETTRGPDLFSLYEAARKAEQQERQSRLLIQATPSGCTIYVDDVKVGASPRAELAVAPGRHDVFAECPNGKHSRVQSGTAKDPVNVDVDFDSALDTTGDHVSLVFRTEQERIQHENDYAGRIGRAVLPKGGRVVTVGVEINPRTGTPELVGRIISADDSIQRTAHSIAVPGGSVPSVASTRELGTKLKSKEGEPATGTNQAASLEGYAADPLPPGAQPWWEMNQLDAAQYDYRVRKDYASAIDRALKAAARTDDSRAWKFAMTIACEQKDKARATEAWPHIATRSERLLLKEICADRIPSLDLPLSGADDQLWRIKRDFGQEHYSDAVDKSRQVLAATNDIDAWLWLGMSACALKDKRTARNAKAHVLELSMVNGRTSALPAWHINRICRRVGITLPTEWQ